MEPAILGRTALDDNQTPFHYLLGAWKRAAEMSRNIRPDRDKQANAKIEILKEIRRLCVSYAGLSIMMPDMFADAPRETDLCSYLLQDIYTEVKLPEEFLHELAKRFYDDGLVEVIGSTITGISEEIASLKFNENYRSVLRVYYLFDVSKYRQSPSSCNVNR
jgi:ubiquitin conjugation factor E4 B